MKTMDTKQTMTAIMAAVNELRSVLREDLARDVERQIEGYRRAIWVRDEWCCNEMRQFALEFWNAPKPRNDEMWGIRYQIRSHAVNYCPFCGAFVGPQKSKP